MATSSRRRAAERRRLRRQADRRRQQQSRRRRLNVVVSVIGVLVVVGLVVTLLVATDGSGSSSTPKPKTESTPASTTPAGTPSATTAAAVQPTTAAAVTTCRYPTAGTAARKVGKPSTSAVKAGTATLRLATTQGAVTIALNRTAAPCAVNSIVSLVRQKFYDGTACHRLVNKSIFVLQCGDPTGTGRGGPGYTFADELGASTVFRRGSVVMANSGPNSNGSQFFIVDRDTRLGAYTPLGTVTAGLATIDKVYRAGTSDGSTDGPPKLPFAFRTATVA